MDEDYYYWGTFPMGFPPFFAFSLPNTSRKLDLGGCFCSRPPLQPPSGHMGSLDTVTHSGKTGARGF